MVNDCVCVCVCVCVAYSLKFYFPKETSTVFPGVCSSPPLSLSVCVCVCICYPLMFYFYGLGLIKNLFVKKYGCRPITNFVGQKQAPEYFVCVLEIQ